VTGVHGVFVMNANDHNGLDNRARVMISIDDGKWKLANRRSRGMTHRDRRAPPGGLPLGAAWTQPIAALLTQDGVTNGAIYALLALALVLVFTVTRVIFVAFGRIRGVGHAHARGIAARQGARHRGPHRRHGGACRLDGDVDGGARERRPAHSARARLWSGVPLVVAVLVHFLAPMSLPLLVQVVLALAAVTVLGPLLYRVAYQPVAEASVLVL
jgi:hypothetical protein